MALLPYILLEPLGTRVPLIVDSPHSGRIYPVDFAYACPLPLLRQAEDAYVDEIVASAAQAGAVVVMAEFPRSMIDVNRAENDMDPLAMDGVWPGILDPDVMTLSGFGLVRRLCRNGIPLYRETLTVAEIQRRITLYYRPYHDCLRRQVAVCIDTFGVCYFINMHSMPDRIDNGVPRPDFILGDRDGTSCGAAFMLRAKRILQDMGYRVTCNEPYKGREIVRRYGLQGQGAEALQIEINRKLYLDEILTEKHQGFSQLQQDMAEFFRLLSAWLDADNRETLAAE